MLTLQVFILVFPPLSPLIPPPSPQRPITHALCSIREREASWIHKMARIRATNNALYFAITPIVAFVSARCLCQDADWLEWHEKWGSSRVAWVCCPPPPPPLSQK